MSKSSFFTGQPIFGQLLKFIPRQLVFRIASDLQADRYCKRFSSYDHLICMLYGVFNNCTSLREITTGMLAWEHRLLHLGIYHHPRRSTISDANNRRNSHVFEAIYRKLHGDTVNFYRTAAEKRSVPSFIFLIPLLSLYFKRF